METKAISSVKIKRTRLTAVAILALATTLSLNAFSANSGGGANESYITLDLQLGKMADYGATPWYTSDISLGTSHVNFALDTGSNFIWATSDQCGTPACSMHNKVNTNQPGFYWVDRRTIKRSFGPWGSMQTWTGNVLFDYGTRNANNGNTSGYPDSSINILFFASITYLGSKFSLLAWDGGIGFPSRSDQVEPGSDFFFGKLLESGRVTIAELSMYTNSAEKTGAVYLGGGNPTKFIANTEVVLQPKSSAIPYLWGTNLYDFSVGQQLLPALQNQVFFID
ncbi:MAG: pepsin-like aspartyl protease, partial [bacterium]